MVMNKQEVTFDSCRRLGVERRTYGYDAYFPERRVEEERRSGQDRRRLNLGHTRGIERRREDC